MALPEQTNMTIGDYYVLTRQLRTDGTMEFTPQVGRAVPDQGDAIREARGNAQRLKGDGRPFGVEVHEVIGVGEVGGRPQFVTVFVIENGCEKAAGPPSLGI